MPDWISSGSGRLDDFRKSSLEGNPAVADVYFGRAVAEIKKSGDLSVLSKAYLTRMALDVAILGKARETEFLEIDAVEPDPVHRNFHLFLKGNLKSVQPSLLPGQYAGIAGRLLQGGDEDLADETMKIEDPVSRLIACGVCVGQGRFSERLLTDAVATASRNGWKQAVLVYLERLAVFYAQKGQAHRAATVRERIRLITQ